MQGIHDLLDSERGWFALLLLAIVTVLLVIAKVTADQWLDYTKWLFGFLVCGKTVTTGIELLKKPAPPSSKAPEPTAPAAPAPP